MEAEPKILEETEPFGTPEQARVQQLLVQKQSWIKSQRGLLSQGRSLLLFDGHTLSQHSIESYVSEFGRVLIHAKLEQLRDIAESLRRWGAAVDDRLLLLDGESSHVLAKLDHVQQSRKLPEGWSLDGIDRNAPAEVVRSIQLLQQESLLTPLPGLYLRSIGVQTHTIVLRNDRGELVGSATVQNVAGTRSSFDGTVMPLSACLCHEARGRGISPLLLGSVIAYGIRKFTAARVRDIVEEKEVPAIGSSKACGLAPHQTEGFIFASLSD